MEASATNKLIKQHTLQFISMASVQCHKTCKVSCQQENQHASFGQKVSDLFKGHQHNDHSSNYATQTKVLSQSGSGLGPFTTKTQTQCGCPQTHLSTTHGSNTKGHGHGQGRIKREHKRGMLQNIKDRLSGDTSSDSESDNETCHKRKD